MNNADCHFIAQLSVDGKLVLNKQFRTLAEAKMAYDAAAVSLHGAYARL